MKNEKSSYLAIKIAAAAKKRKAKEYFILNEFFFWNKVDSELMNLDKSPSLFIGKRFG